jgi:large repetitive protein
VSLAGADLGELADLARALGLLDASGGFDAGWMSAPGDHLKHVLADEHQRAGLIAFVEDVLGDAHAAPDPSGLVWLPAFSHSEAGHPTVAVSVVLDESPADHVRIGVGVSATSADARASVKAHVGLFRAGKLGAAPADAVILGTAEGTIQIEAAIEIGDPTIRSAALSAAVPTAGSAAPTLGLVLEGLQLPGAPAPSDVRLTLDDLDQLEDALVQLVLGLVKAQVAALGSGPLAALAGLAGLRDGVALPELPVQDVLDHGVSALASWFEGVIRDDAARAAWLGQLAALLGGTVDGDAVSFALGAARLRIGARAGTGSAGHPTITPFVAVEVGAEGGDLIAAAAADLALIDLGGGQARALPSCTLGATLGRRASGAGTPLLTGDPAVDRLVVGFALDPDRKPTLRLAAEHVTIGGHVHDVLDLSTPGAVAQAAQTMVSDVVDELIGKLGAAGGAVRTLLGLAPPAGFPAVPTVELARFIQDPLGAVAGFWETLVAQHADAVPVVLRQLRDLVADAAVHATDVSGTGTEADPWRVPVVGPAELRAWADGGVLTVALGAGFTVEDLGQGCTRLDSGATVGLVALDLAARHASFLPLVSAFFAARARTADGPAPATVELGPLAFEADEIGLEARWRPVHGVAVGVRAPNLAVQVGAASVPIVLPTLGADGGVALDDAGLDALEGLLGTLAAAAPVGLVADLAQALGWRLRPAGAPVDGPRLRLADLRADARHAIEQWAGELALAEAGELLRVLRPLARALSGGPNDWGALTGAGTRGEAWQLALDASAAAPSLAAWVEPDGPAPAGAELTAAVALWRDGMAALPFEQLLDAALAGADADDALAALLTGRDDLAAGLEALVARWDGSDGRVIPPPADVPGIAVTTLGGVPYDRLAAALDLDALLERTPTTVVRVSVGEHPWLAGAPAERIVRLDAAGLAPEAFPQPAAATGEWFVVLAERAAAKLASGDPDGIAGQAGRLRRVLDALAGVDGAIALVAAAEAGHAAVRAAGAVSAVADVVTLGTPWSPVSLSVIDVAPAAEAARVLAALLPDPPAGDDTEGPDLARARSLLGVLLAALPSDDPVRELRPPSGGPGAIRAGLNVRALYGVLSADLVRRALTALVAGGLRDRGAAARAAPFAAPQALRTGVLLPFAVAPPSGVTVDGALTVELAGLVPSAGGAIGRAQDRAIHLHVELARAGGWLVGGPDPARAPGSRHDVDVRRVEADVTIPLGAAHERASARVVLHEPRVLGLSRPRWVVRTTGSAVAADEATPALPEVRVALSALGEALATAASGDPTLAAALGALRALGLMETGGGFVPDALDHLLHDPAAFSTGVMGDATRRIALAGALRALLGGSGAAGSDALTWSAGPATIALDLAARRASVELTGAGAVPWTLHAAADDAGPEVRLVLGAAGTTPAGGAILTLSVDPALSALLAWHRPGAAAPDTIQLWPALDVPALLRLAALIAPAELGRVGLEYLRRLDESARPIADAALDALGLLATTPDRDGIRPVRLPLGLLTDPLGWLAHAGALGAPGGGLDPVKAAALLDALKPVIGVAGDPGTWRIADGVTVRADAQDGHLRLGVELETAGLTPISPTDERLVASLAASLVLAPNAAPQPALELSVGLPGSAPGRRALHVALDGGGVRAFLRPDTGADIPLFPNPPGLGSLAQAAEQALPLVLDAIAAETGNDLKGHAGAVVRSVGDAMGLRSGSPATFDAAALHAWAADPAAALAARLPTLAATALQDVATALGPALPSGLAAAVVGDELQVTFGTMTLGLAANPFAVRFLAAPANVPGLGRARVEARADGSGLTLLEVQAGPAALDAGGATLRPFFRARVGAAPPGGRRAELGLALDDAGAKAFAARWVLGGSLALVAVDGASESTDPAAVALTALDAVVDLAGGFVIATSAVADLLARHCGVATIGDVLEGVVVHKDGTRWKPVDGLFDVGQLLGRLQRLGANLVQIAQPKLELPQLTLALDDAGGALGVKLIPKGPYALSSGEVAVSIDFDAAWIDPAPAQAGLVLRLLHVGPGPGDVSFQPSLEVDGIGVRIARDSGPLLDVGGVTLGSLAVHLYAKVGLGGGVSGGAQLALDDLAVGVAGASGGNAVAQGVMKDAGSGATKLAPRFSPAIAVQQEPGGEPFVSLRAGDPPGPWWLAIQKGFGPVYIEQVGFDAKVEQRHLQSISILLDGRVSLFGLTAAVDDLSLTFVVASDASVFDPSRWAVDLAGFAIASDLGGIELVGGLRKFAQPGPPDQPEVVQYVGMLLGRFGVYGLSVLGGYGMGRAPDGGQFASFFAFGAVNGPIGGPPAFFLTGIGGGLGINRDLIFPQDLSQFGSFPFIQALDPGAQPPTDPMAVLEQYKDTFPIKQGDFWFAAGISFTSFALVDGVAVVAIEIGDGFELTLLGLARMALPRPQLALVSIELGLICRFSSREGVLWIQAQLTDNSWLLFPQIRLTGGFAFVTWFKGPYAGQFVLTLGGYHPSFHRDGYPVVPRLGFTVDLGFIAIKGESYFALTSEALMAGGKLEASASLGPAWAHLVFGADAIVFFDPFWLDATVYARVSAGVTIDVWIGTITISVSLGASIHLSGPEFHGEASFDVGPVSLTVPFGNQGSEPQPIDYPTFVRKYLEEAPGGAGRALSSVTGRGTLTPQPGAGGAKDVATADGSAGKPFVVVSEFECVVVSTVPLVELRADGVADASLRSTPSRALGIAPMNQGRMDPALRLRLLDDGGADHLPALLNEAGRPRITAELRTGGAFPVGVWGLPQDKDAKQVPSGDVIAAMEGVRLDLHAEIKPGLPPVRYDQVEIGKRRPLPFVAPAVRSGLMSDAAALETLVPTGAPVDDVAARVLAKAGNSATAIAALAQDRAAPPRLGSLTEGLATEGLSLKDLPPSQPPAPPQVDHRVHPPLALALLSPAVSLPERLAAGTKVSDAPDAPRRSAPTLLAAQAAVELAIPAQLRRVPAAAVPVERTVVANGTVPLTRPGRAPVAALRARGTVLDGHARLDALTAALGGGAAPRDAAPANGEPPARTVPPTAAATLAAGEVAVLQLPNAVRDAADGARPSLAVEGAARVVVLGHGGAVLADALRPQAVEIPPGAERIAVLALGDREADAGNGLLSGWHAGQQLPCAGWNAALGSRCLLSTEGVTVAPQRQRRGAGWVKGAELVRGTTTATTRFYERPRAVAIVLDQPRDAQAGAGLALTLGGAVRMSGADGQPLAPTVVAAGARSAVVYPIEPREDVVTVTVASEAAWSLAGVLAGGDVATVADTVAERGLDAAVRPMAAGGGRVSLSWKDA